MNLLGDKIKVKRFKKNIRSAVKHQVALRTAAENLADAKQRSQEEMWDLINEAYPETKGRRCSVGLYGKKNHTVKISFLDSPKKDFGDTSTFSKKDSNDTSTD